MIEPVLLDTGPLVAVFLRRDPNHQRCTTTLAGLKTTPVTTWSVLTEAAWLLRKQRLAVPAMFRMIAAGQLAIAQLDEKAIEYVENAIRRYESSRIDLADATLLYVAKRDRHDTVFTLDRRDFSIYRLSDGRALTLLPD